MYTFYVRVRENEQTQRHVVDNFKDLVKLMSQYENPWFINVIEGNY